jgi:hypothetical protein
MTLKPCPEEYGGRCANGTACKAKGGADAESHNFYFVDKKNKELGKVCTECYRAAAPPKSKAAGKRAREEEEEDATAGDTLLEIIRIYDKRCARASNPGTARAQARGSRVVCPPCACRAAAVCVHSIARRARERLDRESEVSKEALALEFLVYGKFKFERRDKKGVFRFGTEWVSVEVVALQCRDWREHEEKFERRVRKLRAPFTGEAVSSDSDDSSSSSSSDDDDE